MIKMKGSKVMGSKNKTSKELLIDPKSFINKDFIIIVIISIVFTLCTVLGARELRRRAVENNNVVEDVPEDRDETSNKNRDWDWLGAEMWSWRTSMYRLIGIMR